MLGILCDLRLWLFSDLLREKFPYDLERYQELLHTHIQTNNYQREKLGDPRLSFMKIAIIWR